MTTELSRTLRFALVGIASTGLYFSLIIVFRSVFDSIILLTALCYGISMSFNFLAQGLLTFRSNGLSGAQLVRYVMMQSSALIANSLLMALAVDGLDFPLVPSQLVVTATVTVFTYIVSKKWVYIDFAARGS